jgi:hypothetical protein
MYQRLLELIKLIFGKNAINKTIGTRTNVIQLPNNKTKRYIKSDLDIESASDAAAMNAKKEMEELIAEIPKMNDAERLIFEGNLRRLKNRLGHTIGNRSNSGCVSIWNQRKSYTRRNCFLN